MPTLPPIVPERTTAGIAVDPRTLERVVPQTKRSDGSVRKELKIRPGFTPQEDVSRFKGSRQQAKESNALPKGHIVGWVPPSSSQSKTASAAGSGTGGNPTKVSTVDANGQPLSKAALKNAKRKAKKIAEKTNSAPGGVNVEDSEEEEAEKAPVGTAEDAPDTWEDDGDEEASDSIAAPAPAVTPSASAPVDDAKPSPASSSPAPAPSKEKRKVEPGVEGLRRALGGLSVTK